MCVWVHILNLKEQNFKKKLTFVHNKWIKKRNGFSFSPLLQCKSSLISMFIFFFFFFAMPLPTKIKYIEMNSYLHMYIYLLHNFKRSDSIYIPSFFFFKFQIFQIFINLYVYTYLLYMYIFNSELIRKRMSLYNE